jgi:hypothetical protein
MAISLGMRRVLLAVALSIVVYGACLAASVILVCTNGTLECRLEPGVGARDLIGPATVIGILAGTFVTLLYGLPALIRVNRGRVVLARNVVISAAVAGIAPFIAFDLMSGAFFPGISNPNVYVLGLVAGALAGLVLSKVALVRA